MGSASELQNFGEPCNPMLNEVILDILFGYIQFTDLSSCRLVSKFWFRQSLPHWLQKGPKLQLTLAGAPSGGARSMSRFLRLVHDDFRSYKEFQFGGLRVYKKFGVSGDLSSNVGHNSIRQFLRACGGPLTELSLDTHISDLTTTFHALMLSTMSPNLVKLDARITVRGGNVGNSSYYDDILEDNDRHGQLTSLQIHCSNNNSSNHNSFELELPLRGWIKLLARYPNLKTLLHGVIKKPACALALDRMLEAVSIIRRADRRMLDLKHLEIFCDYNSIDQLNHVLARFLEAQLSLETFGIMVGYHTPNETTRQLLASQAETLKKLIIEKRYARPHTFIPPPRMASLETLELHGFLFESLTFLSSFPNLSTLSLHSFAAANLPSHLLQNREEGAERRDLRIPTLTSFHCDYGSVEGPVAPGTSCPYILQLAGLMPNLIDLKVWLDNATFRQVCECWPQLEQLVIVGNAVDDEGIFGIAAGLENVQHDMTSLRALKSVAMTHWVPQYKDDAGPTALTARSAAAFLQLPELKKLEVTLRERIDVAAFRAFLEGRVESVNIRLARRQGVVVG